MKKGQFLVISAVLAGLLVITLSSAISEIQNQEYEPADLPYHINRLEAEAEKITEDGTLTRKERRNFRKMVSYIGSYRTEVKFNSAEPCVSVTLKTTSKRAELPCMD